MVKIVDARKLACPEPVVLTMKALNESDEVITIVDNEVARENVSRLARNQGCRVNVELKADGIYLKLKKDGPSNAVTEPVATGIVLFISSEFLGRGEDTQLGSLLMQSFLHALGGLASRPETILLMNSGVKLVTGDSPALSELKQLENQGIEILACGTCLSRFQLTGKVAVGKVSNMHTIADTLLKARKIVTL